MTTRLLWLLLGSIAGASVIRAQPVVRDSSAVFVEPCTYVKCVLAISRPKQGDERLMIGSLGRTERLGFSGGAVSRAVAADPAARGAASAGRRSRISARVLLYAAFSAMGYLAIRQAASRKGPPLAGNFIGLAEGAGRGLFIVVPAVVIAIPVERRANEHFDRAVRLYNEQLPR
jgi:hypothetical protein